MHSSTKGWIPPWDLGARDPIVHWCPTDAILQPAITTCLGMPRHSSRVALVLHTDLAYQTFQIRWWEQTQDDSLPAVTAQTNLCIMCQAKQYKKKHKKCAQELWDSGAWRFVSTLLLNINKQGVRCEVCRLFRVLGFLGCEVCVPHEILSSQTEPLGHLAWEPLATASKLQ